MQTQPERSTEDSGLGDLLRQSPPSPSDRLPAPADEDTELDDEFENPFDDLDDDKDAGNNRDSMETLDLPDLDRDDLDDDEEDDSDQLLDDDFDLDEELDTPRDLISCEEFRDRIRVQTIDQVSLDISPPYRPDELNRTKYEKLRAKFRSEQPERTFRNIAGEPLATGQFRDLAYGNVVLATGGGEIQLPFNNLSEADLAYVTETFGLPGECLPIQQTPQPRSWSPMTMTWRASNLCHKPYYFADHNLERYGHTHGPWQEPLVQTAHFFGSVLVLPYKMGVHHPRECIYTLGYYRPGNCAPWIIPPVPISAQGILNQTAVMTAGTLLIP